MPPGSEHWADDLTDDQLIGLLIISDSPEEFVDLLMSSAPPADLTCPWCHVSRETEKP